MGDEPFCSCPRCWCRTTLLETQIGRDGSMSSAPMAFVGPNGRARSHGRPPHLGVLLRDSGRDLKARLEAIAVHWEGQGPASPVNLPVKVIWGHARSCPTSPARTAAGVNDASSSPGFSRQELRRSRSCGWVNSTAAPRPHPMTLPPVLAESVSMSAWRGHSPRIHAALGCGLFGDVTSVERPQPESSYAISPRRWEQNPECLFLIASEPNSAMGTYAPRNWDRLQKRPAKLSTTYAARLAALRNAGAHDPGGPGRLKGVSITPGPLAWPADVKGHHF